MKSNWIRVRPPLSCKVGCIRFSKLWGRAVLLFILPLVPNSVVAEVPEYFGTYAHDGQGLTELTPVRVKVKGTLLNPFIGVENLDSASSVSGLSHLVCYFQSPTRVTLTVSKLEYIETAMIKNLMGKQMTEIGLWGPAEEVRCSIGLESGTNSMYKIRPKEALVEGIYALHTFQIGSFEGYPNVEGEIYLIRVEGEAGGTPTNMMGSSTGGNDYPQEYQDMACADCREECCGPDRWNFCVRNCTSFVAWRLNRELGEGSFLNNMLGGRWGHAHNWDDNATALGYLIDDRPATGAIAHWDHNEIGGGMGHVAYVEAIHEDGQITLTEYNFLSRCEFGQRTVRPEDVPRYIHIRTSATPEGEARTPRELLSIIHQLAVAGRVDAIRPYIFQTHNRSVDWVLSGIRDRKRNRDNAYSNEALGSILSTMEDSDFRPIPDDQTSNFDGSERHGWGGDFPLVRALFRADKNNFQFFLRGDAYILVVRYEGQYRLLFWEDMNTVLSEHGTELTSPKSFAPVNIQWESYEVGFAKAADEGKYIVAFFYTSSDRWSKELEERTFSDEAVKQCLLDEFVSIRIDAESLNPQGVRSGSPTGKELAKSLGVSSFPTLHFFDSEGASIAPLSGFFEADRLIIVLNYIYTGAYLTQEFSEYMAAAQSR